MSITPELTNLMTSEDSNTLDTLGKGSVGTVIFVDHSHDCCHDLRRLGLCEGANVEIVQADNPCLLRCDGSYVAVQRDALRAICVHCPGGVFCCRHPQESLPSGSRP